MKAALIVFIKECRESMRDRRVMLNALLLGPILGPVLFVVILRLTISHQLDRAEKPLPVVVVGAELAPNLIADLKQQGLDVLPPVADVEAAVRSQSIDLALRITKNYGTDWQAGRPAMVELIYDSSAREVSSEADRLRGMLESYSRRNGVMRLLVRGLAPSLIAPVVVATRDQATPQGRGALLFAMLPYFLVLSALVGGMWLAIDSTAGERERQSLEPLLINPVRRDSILLGKMLATTGFSLTSLALSLVAFTIAGWFLPANKLGMSFNLSPGVIITILPVMVPLVLLLVNLQILVTSMAKSAREAQTYLGLLQLVPIIPSVILSVLPIKAQTWMYTVPLMSQQLSVTKLLRGESLPLQPVSLGFLITLVAALIAFLLCKRNYDSERLAIYG
jgi:sodium transport system permease protein